MIQEEAETFSVHFLLVKIDGKMYSNIGLKSLNFLYNGRFVLYVVLVILLLYFITLEDIDFMFSTRISYVTLHKFTKKYFILSVMFNLIYKKTVNLTKYLQEVKHFSLLTTNEKFFFFFFNLKGKPSYQNKTFNILVRVKLFSLILKRFVWFDIFKISNLQF